MDNSTQFNTVSYKTNLPVGYVFNPTEDEIYSHFIPRRILNVDPPILGVEDVNLYDESPDNLFRSRDLREHIYLFTRLKKEKESHTRIKRTAGSGTWLGQKPTPCNRVINGEEIKIGTMRQFTYKGGKDEWVMHEYCVVDNFLNYVFEINKCTHLVRKDNPNVENIVFCHVYNKKAKKGNEIGRINEEIVNQQKKRKMNSNCHVHEDNHENVDHRPLLLEPQIYDRSNVDQAHPLAPQGVDQAHPLAPQGENDLCMMPNYKNYHQRLLPDPETYHHSNVDQAHDDQGFIIQEPTFHYLLTSETNNKEQNVWFPMEELLIN